MSDPHDDVLPLGARPLTDSQLDLVAKSLYQGTRLSKRVPARPLTADEWRLATEKLHALDARAYGEEGVSA